ncbi:acyl-CoA reductase-like NAD-dependent aldehyde dehydrogenase [Saccharothrix tamanrassetensis]|uniref:Acyl-CoA reductase-like NAD-dependent aldehyde dehydrogenase n=1 Tax=Saccharothrix tamanrassetensis TaxID=1051531 RepID=A0A841C5L2_9PSEU|nr:aldehyde dehydrogenase family protein [Saccharothrix tamanrassetensis]MBB5953822.1 acyl-CoA reductase-like NAD-dependent aldehyde dehydrogenase [Saccharothrix tamanrassetensis]
MRAIDPIGPDGVYRSRDRQVLSDVSGEPILELGLAPPLLVNRIVRRMRAADGQSHADRLAAIARAGALFAEADVDGETPEEYCRTHARLSGVPIRAATRALTAVREAAERMDEAVRAQRPLGVGGSTVWVRRGDVLGVLAPGNHPLPHTLWPAAIALGYRVAVRPSTRDPLTPARLVMALHDAGLNPGYCALLPGPHEAGGALLAAADLGFVFGSADTVAHHQGDPRVRVFGPGHSKILVTAEVDWHAELDVLVASVAGDGGTQCLNATTVLVEGDADGLAEALADRLTRLPVLPPEHPDATVPVAALPDAGRIANTFTAHTAIAYAPTYLGDDSAVLRPVVVGPSTAAPAVEMPFPCVWVIPWRGTDGIAPLRNTLALTLLTTRRDLVAECLHEPTIPTVHWGPTPTTAHDPVLPHDGHLAEFLMTTKTHTDRSAQLATTGTRRPAHVGRSSAAPVGG